MRLSIGSVLAIAATVIVVAAIAAGLLLIERPDEMRAQRFDTLRERHLDDLVAAVNCYWTLGGETKLPASIEDLVSELDEASRTSGVSAQCQPETIHDPETGVAYGYRTVSANEYELCAIFALASAESGRQPTLREWRHDAGEHCFTLSAKKVDLQYPWSSR